MRALADTAGTDRLLTTTRSVRRNLTLERPVEEAVLRECLAIALQAPNGSNRQRWRWIAVTDPDVRRSLASIYEAAYNDSQAEAPTAGRNVDAAQQRVDDSARWLVEHLAEVPALVIACVAQYLTADDGPFAASTLYGSIYPAVWNLQLALSSRGLGSCPTTLLLRRVDETREALDIPPHYLPACMLPVAYVRHGKTFGAAPRRPLDEVLSWNSW